MNPVVYDAGMLIAADRNIRAIWAEHRIRLEAGIVPVVPAPVVAQVSRSPHQVQLRRLLRGCQVTVLTEQDASRLGTCWAAPARMMWWTAWLRTRLRNWAPTLSPVILLTSAACSTPPEPGRGSSALTADLAQLRLRRTPEPRSY